MAQVTVGRVRATHKGNFTTGSTYSKLDRVTYNGIQYECIVDVSSASVAPSSDATHWVRISGSDGVTPSFQVGTVTTLTAGSNATASLSNSGNTYTLNLGIPRGADGSGSGTGGGGTTVSVMTGATTSASGVSGLVPAPSAGAANRYLCSDGTWKVPPDTVTTYTNATQSAAGLMSAADKVKLDGLGTSSGGGTSDYILPTATADTLGGVKIGANITINSGAISITSTNVTTALGFTPINSNVISDATNSTSSTTIASSKAVKTAYDLANNAVAKSSISDATNSSVSTTVASSKAVKTAYDLANSAMPKSGGNYTGKITTSFVTVTNGTIDLSKGNCFYLELSANTTLTITNLPDAGTMQLVTLIILNGDKYTVTWPSTIQWVNNASPSLTSGPDVFNFTILGD